VRRPVLNHQATGPALREGDQFTSDLLDTLPTAILVTRPDTSVAYVNLAFQQLTLFSAEEVMGHRAPYPWTSPEVPDTTPREQDRARRDGSRKLEKLIRKKNGEQCRVEITLVPVRHGGRLRYYLQSWIDITRQEEAESLLNRRIRELQWHSDLDKASLQTDMPFEVTLLALAELLRKACPSPETTCVRITVNDGEFKTPDFVQTAWRQTSSIRVRGLAIGRVDVCRRRPLSGADRVQSATEEKLLTTIVATKVAEVVERIRGGELFRILTNSSPVGIYVERDGRFQYANPELQEYTGYTEEELLGKRSLDIVYREDREQVRQHTVRMLKGETTSPYECRVVRKDGQTRWIVQKTTSIIYEGKRAVLGYYMDITDRKELEWDIAEYKELDQLKRNLLSTVSHELRTPLSNIKGYANMLIDYEHRLTDAQRREFVRGIDKDTDRLTGFVNDLLNLSRLEAGLLSVEKKPRSIARLLREVVDEARMRAPAHRIALNTARGLPRASMDASRIRQVLDNLIDNACKYSPDGTEIAVSASETDGGILVGVRDQGIGIPPEDLGRVFDPMYRIKREQTREVAGIGLGLSVCKGLVDAHGGRIWFESEVGRGSTCWFTLPVRRRRAAAGSRRRGSTPNTSGTAGAGHSASDPGRGDSPW